MGGRRVRNAPACGSFSASRGTFTRPSSSDSGEEAIGIAVNVRDAGLDGYGSSRWLGAVGVQPAIWLPSSGANTGTRGAASRSADLAERMAEALIGDERGGLREIGGEAFDGLVGGSGGWAH